MIYLIAIPCFVIPCFVVRVSTNLQHTHTLRTLDQDPEDLKRFRKLQREAIRPNAQIISDFKSWTSSKKNFTVFGAPYQADAQMIYLLRKFSGWIQGVIRYVFICMHAC